MSVNTKATLLQKLKIRANRKLKESSTASGLDLHNNDSENAYLIHELQTHQIEIELQNEELKHSQLELSNAYDEIVNLYDFAPIGYITTDDTGRILKSNMTFSNMLGHLRNQVVGKMFCNCIHPKDRELFNEHLRSLKSDYEECSIELRIIDREKQPIWVQCRSVKNGDQSRQQKTIRIAVLNIHDRKMKDEELKQQRINQNELFKKVSYQAQHDSLTDLVNRKEFELRLERLLETRGQDAEHALCYLDLDLFKSVNDTCGHLAGDELLRQLSAAISAKVRQRDTFARIGGDEFAILMEHCPLADAVRLTETVREIVEAFQFSWESKTFKLSVSIGLVPIKTQVTILDELLKQADAACYMAKQQGRNRIHVYRASDEELIAKRGELQWISRIQNALAEDMFVLYVQRIIGVSGNDTASSKNHIELLLRMKVQDSEEIICPGAFLGAGERFNLSTKMDHWVTDEAIRLLSQHSDYIDTLELCCINLSGASLTEMPFLLHLKQNIENSGLDATKLCFEITETAAIRNLNKAIYFIKTLKETGCKFSLDDFGSGFSSFAYLKSLPVDYLKIDGMFIKGIDNDPVNFAIVNAINEVAKQMSKKTIAEFVENNDVLTAIKRIGIDYAQGYFFGKPIALIELLENR